MAIETTLPFFNLFGSARVLLAHVYLQTGLRTDALAAVESALTECEEQRAPGHLLFEGWAAVPVLELAVEHTRHAALARQLLAVLRPGVDTLPRPITVPETGELLSVREIDVLRLIVAGASNGDIAQRLVISPHTVKAHVAHILAKLNVANRTQAAARARALGITP